MKIKTLGAVIAAAVLPLALTACGGDDSAAYCDAVKSVDEKFGEDLANAEDREKIKEAATAMEDIAADAPDDIKGDWDTIIKGLNDLADESLTEDVAKKTDASMEKAEKHAMKECDIDIS